LNACKNEQMAQLSAQRPPVADALQAQEVLRQQQIHQAQGSAVFQQSHIQQPQDQINLQNISEKHN
jgi:hypothetical protein